MRRRGVRAAGWGARVRAAGLAAFVFLRGGPSRRCKKVKASIENNAW